ncbi:unnamed protein product [Paramecium pentaurelia]|uniref:MORN repeat protein n=1 Tax=Paramecium pentaurelia TaxID=43138 RepID=A0A8S1W7F3_9CILI|nr:unnamed protein product [Paramecium pentaurelia]
MFNIQSNEQIQQEIISKISHLQLSETDDDNSRQGSPALDSRLLEVIRELPQHLKQKLGSLIPKTNYQLIKQNDDSIYYGIMENLQKQGEGIQIWSKAGNLLEGQWENDQLEGYCRMNYANGDSFECQFKQGRTNGFGIFKSQKKIVKGLWIDNAIQGEGQEIKIDGTKYFGQFYNGKKDGRGILILNDGCKYEGQFKNNLFHGEGTFLWNDGSNYTGTFTKGLILGFGQYMNGNGIQMIGQFTELKQPRGCNEEKNQHLQTIVFVNQYNQSLMIEKIRTL